MGTSKARLYELTPIMRKRTQRLGKHKIFFIISSLIFVGTE